MIDFDSSPEGGTCKFIAKEGEGMRGLLLSTNEDKTEGVVLSIQDSDAGDVKFGKLYLVNEINSDEHPRQGSQVSSIPKNHGILNLKEAEEEEEEES